MKFPRTSKILRSPFDFAPFAAVFFLLVIFLALGMLITTPGVPLQIPAADDLPGTSRPTVDMAVDALNRFYFENQLVSERQLKTSLHNAVHSTHEQLTLVIHADKSVTYEQLLHLTLLARGPGVGITNILLATLPSVTDMPAKQ
jgi:biopolymer transport protein ExbD